MILFLPVSLCCCCSVTQSRPTLCNPMNCSTPGLPVPHHLPEFTQVRVHCIGDAIQPSHPLTPSSPLPSIFPSIRDFSSEFESDDQNIGASALTSVLPLDYSGSISLKINWFDLLVVQGTFRGLLQLYSLKASILWLSAFFMVQLS